MHSRMAMYRRWTYDQLENVIPAFERLVTTMENRSANTLRDGGTGWTVVEVICHLRDFDRVFMERAELTLREEYPALAFPDPDMLARERNYNALSPDMALSQWEVARREMTAVFMAISEDDDETWERIGAHPKRGPFSLNDQLLLVARHDVIHLEQIVKIINNGR